MRAPIFEDRLLLLKTGCSLILQVEESISACRRGGPPFMMDRSG